MQLNIKCYILNKCIMCIDKNIKVYYIDKEHRVLVSVLPTLIYSFYLFTVFYTAHIPKIYICAEQNIEILHTQS